ncbi:MAG: glycoside hydrolase family 2 TIM barrel-domain containing protein [Eubacterium sp.]
MRKIININNNWKFCKKADKIKKPPKKAGKDWESVKLPHTWNNLDGQDGGSDFYRGKCWYIRDIEADIDYSQRAYLEFEGASMLAEVYVNGIKAYVHKGGFSTFRVNITPFLKKNKATIAVMVDNSESREIYPQTADFTFFGGLYRAVNLIIVKSSHFDLDYFGAPGIAVTPVLNDDGSADISVEAYTTNADSCTVRFETADMVKEGGKKAVFHIDNPHLWNGRIDPYLYTMTAHLIKNGEIIDTVTQRYGIRSFRVDPEKGFFLNGKAYPLHGVSRHQDRLDKGWAISKSDHKEDMELIKEIGANTIRLAHYQHDQYFYDLCDEAGMIIWAEIPFISVFMDTPSARQNTISQMKELVIQNYNHPSIVCWGIANEITIGDLSDSLIDNLKCLNDLCHELDKTRYTTMANLTMVEMDSPINRITDILSYNHYFGWYMGSVDDNGPWIDEFHKLNPDIALGISEYGCEGILDYHNDNPQMQDYSEEYQAYYHEEMLKTFEKRPFLWSTHVWNMFDFASDMRDEGGCKGRNNKGLVTFDRKTKKDSFFIYKAYWSDEKFVHICSRRYVDRTNENIKIKVYSNCDSVTLYVNGKELETKSADKIFIFDNVTLVKGENTVKAVSGDCTDEITLNLTDTPNESYTFINENVGTGAKNWFEGVEVDGEIEYPEGYFTIKDKIGDIMKNPEGKVFIDEMIAKVSEEMNMNVSKGMMNMAKNFTIEKVFDMAGSRVPKEAKLFISQKLNKIKK